MPTGWHGTLRRRPARASQTAVTIALRERLQRLRTPSPARDVELDEIFERASRVPARDPRSDEEILGYDEAGTFG